MTTLFTRSLSGAATPVLFLLLAFGMVSNCAGLKDLNETCSETPSTTYLVSVRNLDYAQIGSNFLTNPVNHNVDVCVDFFAASTQAGHQYNEAVGEINRQLGSELHFTTTRTGVVHKDPFDLFPSNPTASFFDYVDVSKPMPNKCSLPGDLTFAMRTCRHDKSAGGGTDHFTIMVNSSNYDHFSDLSSDDYPQKHGILHELAHAFGMNHTGSWAAADKKYISTMQGNLEYLSALDVCYLRHKYPTGTPAHRNYVASSLTRFDETKGKFEDQNPSSFYVDANNNLLDCSTDQAPEFFVAWFNTGNMDGETDLCGMNRIYLREKLSQDPETIEIKTWKIAAMPFLSQDQWKGQVNVTVDNQGNIDFNREWELVFEVNAYDVLAEETREDNIITKDVSLYENSSCRNVLRTARRGRKRKG